MKRPNKKDYLTTNQIEYNQMLNKYYDDLEAYIDILEEQLTLTDVVVPKGTLCNKKQSPYDIDSNTYVGRKVGKSDM